MGVIYDIAGTSSDSFMLNGKLTFLQGNDDPTPYQGQDGDVYFQTNGNIWTKVNGNWINISSMALPKASDIKGKLLYSDGEYYVPTDFNWDDIALKSMINEFVNEAIFENSATFKDGLDISQVNPHIDFHFNNSTGDYTVRLVEKENGVLSIESANGQQNRATASTSSDDIATKGWCNDPTKSLNLVHRTGNEDIAGNKKFTGVVTCTQTIQGNAFGAYWGDLAEYYESDNEYPKGTLVQFGGEKEITIAADEVNAVITSEPGVILNNKDGGQAIALVGRVPVRVIGKVNKFDHLTLSEIPGVARVLVDDEFSVTNVIARALESKDYDEEGLVLCVIKFEI